jgi:Peptidase family C50
VHTAVKRSNIIEDEHTFLILDKRLQGIPWESIPILRGRAVSRIPSLSFLVDRLHLASVSGKSVITTKNQAIDRVSVDPTKVYYLLNPEGDLKRTEETFTPWLKSMNRVGWAGIIGRHPAEFELKDALNRRDLFMCVIAAEVFSTFTDHDIDTLAMEEPSSIFEVARYALYCAVPLPCCGAVPLVPWRKLGISIAPGLHITIFLVDGEFLNHC